MLIEDKTDKTFFEIVKESCSLVSNYIPKSDLEKIEKLVILNQNKDSEYKESGAMYYLEKGNTPALIEIYPLVIFEAMPKFLPRNNFFKRYSIVRLLLHEIGHHVYRKYAYKRDKRNWEGAAYQYMNQYVWKIYKFWNILFRLAGQINIWLMRSKQRQTPS